MLFWSLPRVSRNVKVILVLGLIHRIRYCVILQKLSPLAVEDRGGVRVMMLHYSGFQTNPFASLEW